MQEWSMEEVEVFLDTKETGYLYLYTPMCGTCQIAGKMMEVVEQLIPETTAGKANLNYLPEIASRFRIESVPCLVIVNKGEVEEKIYAFQSVPNLYEKLKYINHPS